MPETINHFREASDNERLIPEPMQKSQTRPLVVVIAVLTVALCLVIGFGFRGKSDTPAKAIAPDEDEIKDHYIDILEKFFKVRARTCQNYFDNGLNESAHLIVDPDFEGPTGELLVFCDATISMLSHSA